MRNRVDELASLMEEFSLDDAEMSGPGWRVQFKRNASVVMVQTSEAVAEQTDHAEDHEPMHAAQPEEPKGTVIASPMNGIYYASPSPNAEPFVREGDIVTAGHVVCLIEAMKVFNEVPSPVSGTVQKIVVESGSIVQPGQPLLYIG